MPSPLPARSTLGPGLAAGLVIGALDALAATAHAYAFSGVGPDRVFRFVAAGAFGRDAFTGSPAYIAAGLLFHFLIAIAWTALFFVLTGTSARDLRDLRAPTRAAALGAFYGLAVWLVMNLAVIPLSRLPSRALTLTTPTLAMIAIHVVVIGIPIGLLARRHQLRAR
jgi:hypothetical protein